MSISLVIYVLFYFLFATSFIILVNKDGQKTYVKGACDLSLEEQPWPTMTCTEIFLKFGHAVFEIHEHTERQTC